LVGEIRRLGDDLFRHLLSVLEQADRNIDGAGAQEFADALADLVETDVAGAAASEMAAQF